MDDATASNEALFLDKRISLLDRFANYWDLHYQCEYMGTCVVTIAISFMTCVIVHHILSPILSSKLFLAYRNLDWKVRMEWDSRIVSSIHASTVSILATYALITENLSIFSIPQEDCQQVSIIAISITIGYFLCDTISMPLYWSGIDMHLHILHHVAATLGFWSVIYYNVLLDYSIFRLMCEYSTPFTNQRWFYRTLGYPKDYPMLWWSSFCFCILFFIFRDFWILPISYVTYLNFKLPTHVGKLGNAYYPVYGVWLFSGSILDILNIYWTRSVIRIFKKVIGSKSKSVDKSN